MKESTDSWLRAAVAGVLGAEPPRAIRVLSDTSAYMSIERGDVLLLDGKHYVVRGNARETRFGLQDQPKFWVKRACCAEDGRSVVLKLVFHEEFSVKIGDITMRCRRSELKEARVLDLVASDPRFMHGTSVKDSAGNLVRVLEYIPGRDLLTHVMEIPGSWRTYFERHLPGILALVCEGISALQVLHEAGLCHGDVRNDHLRLDSNNGLLRWIDFDLEQDYSDYDIWCVGNILQVACGKGLVTLQRILEEHPEAFERLEPADTSVLFPHRVMNLGKVFPGFPEELNRILMRFSAGTEAFYESIEQVALDLRQALEALGWPAPRTPEELKLDKEARCSD